MLMVLKISRMLAADVSSRDEETFVWRISKATILEEGEVHTQKAVYEGLLRDSQIALDHGNGSAWNHLSAMVSTSARTLTHSYVLILQHPRVECLGFGNWK